MRNFDSRLRKIEAQMDDILIRQRAAEIAAEYGLDVEELLEEAQELLALPRDALLAEVDALADQFSPEAVSHLKAILTIADRPMG
jgi:hypothetical protein